MSTDPVIAALRKQQRLHDAFVSAVDTDKSSAAAAAYNAAFDELLRTKPRTRGGAAALIRHCLTASGQAPSVSIGSPLVH